MVPGRLAGLLRISVESRCQAMSCGCVRVVLQWRQRRLEDFSASESKLATGLFFLVAVFRRSGADCEGLANMERRSDLLILCSLELAMSPHIQQVWVMDIWLR